MAYPAQQHERHFTYRDLQTWPDEERWELIDGVAYDMSPSPKTRHQLVSSDLNRQFANFLIGKPCVVFSAPFDVLLPKGNEAIEDIDTVVQPDLLVVCNRKKINENNCIGAPDLIIEILSPSTTKKDQSEKYALYERAGIREYWIVDPSQYSAAVYRLDENGRYGLPEVYDAQDSVPVGVLEGLSIDLSQVFAILIEENDADF